MLARRLLPFSLVLALGVAPLAATDGTPDPRFGINGRKRVPFDLGGSLADRAEAAVVDPQGRILLAGSADTGAFGLDCAVARLLPDGGFDSTFDGDGRATWDSSYGSLDDLCSDVAAGPGGEVYAAAVDGLGLLCLLRFAPSRSSFCFPTTWDLAPRMAVQPDGKILFAWSDGDFRICRYLDALGNEDPLFGSNGCTTVAFDLGGGLHDTLRAIALQPDGRILLAGSAEWGNGDTDFAVARLTASGTLDAGFGFGGERAVAFDLAAGQPDWAAAVTVAPGGGIYLAGGAGTGFLSSETAIAWVSRDGAFTSAAHFELAGAPTSQATGVAVQDDGRVVVAGTSVQGLTDSTIAVVRRNPDLSADGTFAGGAYEFDPNTGRTSTAAGLVLQGGHAVVAGTAEWSNPDYDFGVLRLEASLIFADGFERGSTGHWTAAAP